MDDNIWVSLTTTGFVYKTTHQEGSQLVRQNIPVCCAEMVSLLVFEENLVKDLLKSLSKEVKVDVERQEILIGTDGEYLVEYRKDKPSQFSSEFFLRWEATHTLLFEFVIKTPGSAFWNNFSLRGLWMEGRWSFLDFYEKNSIEIMELLKGTYFAG